MIEFTADNTYISISRTAGERLRELGVFRDDAEWSDMRRVLVAAISSSSEKVKGTIELHFIAKVRIESSYGDKDVALVCVVSPGSPARDKKHTMLIRGALSEDQLERLLGDARGLTNLKHNSMVGRIGAAARIARKGKG